MSVFGPTYPPPLHGSLRHAERFCELLAELEQRGRRGKGKRWLVRRRQEIVTFLGLVVKDWSEGRIAVKKAASEVDTYLADLHVGVRHHLDLGPVLDCCLADEMAAVVTASVDESPSRIALGTVLTANDTLFEPRSHLKGLAGENFDNRQLQLMRPTRPLVRKRQG